MKRVLLIVPMVLLVSSILFAAGGGQQSGTPSGKEILEVYLWGDPAVNGFNQIAAEFKKTNPNVEIEYQFIPFDNYEDKVRTTLAGGDAPDLIQVNDDYVRMYTNRKLLLPLTKYVNQLSLNPDNYFKPIWDFNIINGDIMAFTPLTQVRLLVYNKDLLKAAGLPEPPTKWGDPNWNWDTLKDYAMKLTKREGNVTTQWGLLWTIDGPDQIFTSCFNGEGIVGADRLTATGCNDAAKEAIQWMVDSIHSWKVTPPQGDHPNNENVFMSGNAGFNIAITSNFANYRKNITFDWDIAPIPIEKYSYNEGSLACYGIPTNAKNPDLSAKFLFYLGEDFAQKTFAELGNVPINKKYAEQYYIQPGVKPLRMQVALDGLNHNKSINFGDYTDEARRAYRVYLNMAFAGEMTVGAALDAAKPEVEACLAGKF